MNLTQAWSLLVFVSFFFIIQNKALASLITSSDIASLSVTAPDDWKTYNTHQLFDGIHDRYTKTRFAAYQKSGSLLSTAEPYIISISLVEGKAIDSLGFYNDWRHHLGQQVRSMDIDLYNELGVSLWSGSFSNLQQNSWEKISLFDFSAPVADVKKIDFTVTESQGNHFEIRELLVSYTPSLAQTSSSAVNAPSIAVLISLCLLALVLMRLKKQ